jgi:tRNA pseudouridine38-40 synthase
VRTLALWLDYDGTDFRGFGVQPSGRTVQGVLEAALGRATGEVVRVTPAARTDAGVHARGQVVSFRSATRLEPATLQRACNALLPADLLATAAREMPAGFDARRSATGRRYRYTVWNAPLPCVWRRRYQHHVPHALDVDAMEAAAGGLVGMHDFRAFASDLSAADLARGTVRTVTRSTWRRDGPLVTFEVSANAFLRHMVRGMVGTLLEVGRHRRGASEIETILRERERRLAGPNAPSVGLTLVGVDYE